MMPGQVFGQPGIGFPSGRFAMLRSLSPTGEAMICHAVLTIAVRIKDGRMVYKENSLKAVVQQQHKGVAACSCQKGKMIEALR